MKMLVGSTEVKPGVFVVWRDVLNDRLFPKDGTRRRSIRVYNADAVPGAMAKLVGAPE